MVPLRFLTPLLVIAATLVVLGAEQSRSAPALPHYSVTDLGTLAPDRTNSGQFVGASYALGINNSGQVVGQANTSLGQPHAFLWDQGVMKDLGTLGGSTSTARAINDAGQIVGQATTADELTHAALWSGGPGQDLGTLGSAPSSAAAINARGTIVGASSDARGRQRAFTRDGGTMQDLGAPQNTVSIGASGINDDGDVVGSAFILWDPSGTEGAGQPVLWRAGQMLVLYHPDGPYMTSAVAVNNLGVVLGNVNSTHYVHPFTWNSGAFTNLDTGAWKEGIASGFNDQGQVVGLLHFPLTGTDDPVAALWDHGAVINLNDTIPGDSGWVLQNAIAINKSGWIVGVGLHNGQQRGFLLTPAAPPPPPPGAPSNLAAAVVSSTEIDLRWSDGGGVKTRYEVERADGSGNFSLLASVGPDQTAYADRSVASGGAYSYRVRAVSASGASGYSNVAQASVLAQLALNLILSSHAAQAKAAVTLNVILTNPGTTPVPAASWAADIPVGLTYVSSKGATWDATRRRLSWTGALAARQSLAIAVKLRVDDTSTVGTVLTITGGAHANGFADVTASGALTVWSGQIPQSVDLNDSGGAGILTGHRDVQYGQGTPPLYARISPVPDVPLPFVGSRRFHIWMGASATASRGVTIRPTAHDAVAGVLATDGLIAPDVSPEWDVVFQKVGDTATIQVEFTPVAAALTISDLLISQFAGDLGLELPSIAEIMEVEHDLLHVSAIYKAAQEFSPAPKGVIKLTAAAYRAVKDLAGMKDTEARLLSQILTRLLHRTVNVAELLSKIGELVSVKEILATMDDLGVLVGATNGLPMALVFSASPLHDGPQMTSSAAVSAHQVAVTGTGQSTARTASATAAERYWVTPDASMAAFTPSNAVFTRMPPNRADAFANAGRPTQDTGGIIVPQRWIRTRAPVYLLPRLAIAGVTAR